jgi:hypothetical protein
MARFFRVGPLAYTTTWPWPRGADRFQEQLMVARISCLCSCSAVRSWLLHDARTCLRARSVSNWYRPVQRITRFLLVVQDFVSVCQTASAGFLPPPPILFSVRSELNRQAARPRRVKTAQISQRSEVSNAVLLSYSLAVRRREVLPWPWTIHFVDGRYCASFNERNF